MLSYKTHYLTLFQANSAISCKTLFAYIIASIYHKATNMENRSVIYYNLSTARYYAEAMSVSTTESNMDDTEIITIDLETEGIEVAHLTTFVNKLNLMGA